MQGHPPFLGHARATQRAPSWDPRHDCFLLERHKLSVACCLSLAKMNTSAFHMCRAFGVRELFFKMRSPGPTIKGHLGCKEWSDRLQRPCQSRRHSSEGIEDQEGLGIKGYVCKRSEDFLEVENPQTTTTVILRSLSAGAALKGWLCIIWLNPRNPQCNRLCYFHPWFYRGGSWVFDICLRSQNY